MGYCRYINDINYYLIIMQAVFCFLCPLFLDSDKGHILLLWYRLTAAVSMFLKFRARFSYIKICSLHVRHVIVNRRVKNYLSIVIYVNQLLFL